MRALTALLLAALAAGPMGAQSRKPAPGKPATAKPAAPALKIEPATVRCPALLGTGVKTGRSFCDVLAARKPEDGVAIAVPPHQGTATISFDLHNRHTYSPQEVQAGRAFAEYTATLAVATADGQLISRAGVSSAFRSAADLVDRVSGGAGPSGVKAVAPTGTETVLVRVPATVTEVFLLGERLTVATLAGRAVYTAAGRPIATISNVTVEYKPVPPKKPAASKKTPAKRGATGAKKP